MQFCIKVWSCWQRTKTWHVFWHIFTLFLSPSSRKRSETDCLTLAHTGTRFNPDPRREAGLAVLGVSHNSTGVSLVQFSNLSAASATANDCNGGGLILGWHRHRTRFWMKVKGNKGNIRKYIKLNMDQWIDGLMLRLFFRLDTSWYYDLYHQTRVTTQTMDAVSAGPPTRLRDLSGFTVSWPQNVMHRMTRMRKFFSWRTQTKQRLENAWNNNNNMT